MTTALITHADSLKHITPDGHPEQVARLSAVNAALQGFDLLRVDAPLGLDEHILRAHPQRHIDHIRAAGIGALDADTHMSAGSLNAALRGVGANIAAVDMVMSGQVTNAFCAIRPPGHHAETAKPMGFCLFGNVVIAAKHALEAHGLSRVAIMDFDVHHGNGTQNLVWDDARIFFASTHQMPLYPGSGAADEIGAHGQIMNVPLPAESDGTVFRDKMTTQILPAIDAWKPELILISAGFDAHRDDPLANLNWVEDDFVWATQQLCTLAAKHCDGRLVSTLEGGYNLDALAASVAAHVSVLQEFSS
ncbi:MAG: histone deacetylase family protein [Rhodobacteraceae bacterium]|nr:histone deacetylase family protein [Paracoccaceae bacterium]